MPSIVYQHLPGVKSIHSYQTGHSGVPAPSRTRIARLVSGRGRSRCRRAGSHRTLRRRARGVGPGRVGARVRGSGAGARRAAPRAGSGGRRLPGQPLAPQTVLAPVRAPAVDQAARPLPPAQLRPEESRRSALRALQHDARPPRPGGAPVSRCGLRAVGNPAATGHEGTAGRQVTPGRHKPPLLTLRCGGTRAEPTTEMDGHGRAKSRHGRFVAGCRHLSPEGYGMCLGFGGLGQSRGRDDSARRGGNCPDPSR